jgi:hypothetical protein
MIDGVQFLLAIAVVILIFIVVDRIAAFLWPDQDKELMDEWQAIRKTLDQPGASVPEEFWKKVADRTGATPTQNQGAGARPPTRTLRGDIIRVWERCKRTIRTRF